MAVMLEGGEVAPFHGDHEPVSVYEGETPIFTPTELAKSGTAVEFDHSYNHVAEVEVAGKSEQVQLTGKNMLKSVMPVEEVRGNPSTVYNLESGKWYASFAFNGYAGGYSRLENIVLEDDSISFFCSNAYGLGAIIDVEAGKTYFISATGSYYGGKGTGTVIRVAKIKDGLFSGQVTSHNAENLRVKFTAEEGFQYMAIFMSSGTDYHVDGTTVTFRNIQIEEGSTATDYEPYCGSIPSPNPDYPQEITSVDSVELVSRGMNCASIPYYQVSRTTAGITFTNLPDGGVRVQGTATSSAYHNLDFYDKGIQRYIGKPVAGRLFGAVAGMGLTLGYFHSDYESNYNLYKGIVSCRDGNEATMVIPQDAKASRHYMFVQTGITVDTIVYPMFVYGSNAVGEYEPYYSTTRTIDLQGHELRSLPDGTKDELRVHRDGSVELVQVGYLFRSTIGAMNNSDDYPGWRDAGLNDNVGDKINYSITCYSNIGGLRPSGYMAQRIGVNTNSRPGSVWFYASSFGMAQSELIAKHPDTAVEMYIKRTNPQTIALPSIDPLPTYYPTTVITDTDGNDLTAYVHVIDTPQESALISLLAQMEE